MTIKDDNLLNKVENHRKIDIQKDIYLPTYAHTYKLSWGTGYL